MYIYAYLRHIILYTYVCILICLKDINCFPLRIILVEHSTENQNITVRTLDCIAMWRCGLTKFDVVLLCFLLLVLSSEAFLERHESKGTGATAGQGGHLLYAYSIITFCSIILFYIYIHIKAVF